MEGTQPSAAGGDGAPTAMVAVPGLPGALTQGYPLLGGSGTVSMEASLRLRADRAPFLQMQTETRSILGLLIWLSIAYPQISMATNKGCGHMANPSWSVNAFAANGCEP